jgi:predicted lipoprotein with Yx(FWY)xxD motif
MRILQSKSRARTAAVAAVVLLGIVAAALGASTSRGGVAGASHSASSAAVKTRKINGLGVVLVNAQGRTLYVFMKDKQQRVTCTGSCASIWFALKAKGSGKPAAGGAAKASLLGSDKSPSGGRVVTYNRWPLYTYAGDTRVGSAKGQTLNLNGGRWYVISPAGKVIEHAASSGGGGGTTTTGGGGGWG